MKQFNLIKLSTVEIPQVSDMISDKYDNWSSDKAQTESMLRSEAIKYGISKIFFGRLRTLSPSVKYDKILLKSTDCWDT